MEDRRFGNKPTFNGPREMHKATCADCGQETEVPFKPVENRPVYCRTCYMAKQGDRQRR